MNKWRLVVGSVVVALVALTTLTLSVKTQAISTSAGPSSTEQMSGDVAYSASSEDTIYVRHDATGNNDGSIATAIMPADMAKVKVAPKPWK